MNNANNFLKTHSAPLLSQQEFNEVTKTLNNYESRKYSYIKIVKENGAWKPRIYQCNWFQSLFYRLWKPETMRVHNVALWMITFLQKNNEHLSDLDSKTIVKLSSNLHSLSKQNKSLSNFLEEWIVSPRDKILVDVREKSSNIVQEANDKAARIIQHAQEKAVSLNQEASSSLRDAQMKAEMIVNEAITKENTLTRKAQDEILLKQNSAQGKIHQQLEEALQLAEEIKYAAKVEANKMANEIFSKAEMEVEQLNKEVSECKAEIDKYKNETHHYCDTLFISEGGETVPLDSEFLGKAVCLKALYSKYGDKSNLATEHHKKDYPLLNWVLRFPEYSYETIEAFRRYVIHGEKCLIELADQVLANLYKFSDYIQFDQMENDLSQELKGRKCFRDINFVMDILTGYTKGAAFEESLNYFSTHLKEIESHQEFKDIPLSTMKALLKRENIWVASEWELFLFVDKWVKEQIKKQQDLKPETLWRQGGEESLFNLLKKEYFSIDQLAEFNSNKIMTDDEGANIIPLLESDIGKDEFEQSRGNFIFFDQGDEAEGYFAIPRTIDSSISFNFKFRSTDHEVVIEFTKSKIKLAIFVGENDQKYFAPKHQVHIEFDNKCLRDDGIGGNNAIIHFSPYELDDFGRMISFINCSCKLNDNMDQPVLLKFKISKK